MESRGLDDKTGGVARSKIRRSKDDVGSILCWKESEPVSERDRLTLPQVGERDIDVADVERYHGVAGLERGIARDIPGRFSVANDVEQVRPDLVWLHARKQVKERTSRRFEIARAWCEPCSSLGHEINA